MVACEQLALTTNQVSDAGLVHRTRRGNLPRPIVPRVYRSGPLHLGTLPSVVGSKLGSHNGVTNGPLDIALVARGTDPHHHSTRTFLALVPWQQHAEHAEQAE